MGLEGPWSTAQASRGSGGDHKGVTRQVTWGSRGGGRGGGGGHVRDHEGVPGPLSLGLSREGAEDMPCTPI